MMIERLGSGPIGEDLAVGTADNYLRRSRIECWEWQQQIERMFPFPPELQHSARYGAASFEREDGHCLEILFKSLEESPATQAFFQCLKANLPQHWDEEAKQKLEYKFAQLGLPAPIFAELVSQ